METRRQFATFFFRSRVLVIAATILFIISCKKSDSTGGVDTGGTGGTPGIPLTSNSSTDTGISYNATAACEYNQNITQLTSAGWTVAFEDNFDGDLSKWDTWTGGGNTNELQHFQPNNLTVSSGMLQMAVRKENVTGQTNLLDKKPKDFKYTSARIETKAKFAPTTATPKIRISARIKLPGGFGIIPVFLSYDNPWPTKGHINMLIADGQAPKRYITNYFYGNAANINAVANAFGYITSDADLTTCYHVYEMEWSQDALTFYLDGKVVERKTSGGHIASLFGKSQKLALYVAVQSELIYRSKIQPGTMGVDWVRVYTSK